MTNRSYDWLVILSIRERMSPETVSFSDSEVSQIPEEALELTAPVEIQAENLDDEEVELEKSPKPRRKFSWWMIPVLGAVLAVGGLSVYRLQSKNTEVATVAKRAPLSVKTIEAARNWLVAAPDKAIASGLQYRRTEDSPVVEIVVEGKITAADIDNVIKSVEADLAKYDKLRVLEDIRDFKGLDPMALWIDLKQISKIQKISHAAIVADAKWVKTVAEAIGGLYPFEIRVFEQSQISEARTWLETA